MTTPTPAGQARADRGEADLIERVARAIWEAVDGSITGVPWERLSAHPYRHAKVLVQALAAVEVLRGEKR